MISDFSVVDKFKLINSGNLDAMDVLVGDSDYSVRAAVAKHGSNVHRDVLIWDEDAIVREAVASNGSVEQLVFLVNDEDEWVRDEANKRFNMLS